MAAKSITVETHVPIKTVRGLLVSAFEGGSNYWYVIDSYQLGGGYKFADFKEGGKAQPEGDLPSTGRNSFRPSRGAR